MEADLLDLEHQAPQNRGMEQALLGMFINYPTEQVAIGTLSPLLFYTPAHQIIWRAMQDMYQTGQLISDLTIVQYLSNHDQLKEVGGLPYLADLISKYATVPSYRLQYSTELRRLARQRLQLEAGHTLVSQAGRMDSDPQELAQRISHQLLEPPIAAPQPIQGSFSLAESLIVHYEDAEKLAASGRLFSGLDTGFSTLNAQVNGLNKAEMTILAARPSIGKTTLALQTGLHIARHEGVGVGIITLEATPVGVARRITCLQAGLNPDAVRRGILSPDDRDAYYQAVSVFAGLPIHIYQDYTLAEMQTRVTQEGKKQGIGYWIIDHLHRIRGPGDERERLSEATAGIADLAVRQEVPILLLCQLNRDCEDRPDKKPQISDIRGTGTAEQDAVNIWMLYRPGFYEELRDRYKNDPGKTAELLRQVSVLVEKQREGEVGPVPLAWIPEKALFGEYAPSWRVNQENTGTLPIRAPINERKDHD